MREKVQTSLWLDLDVKRLVENNGLNLSRWVNENLRRFFAVSSIEEIDEKISKLKNEIAILQERRKKLIEEGAAETVEDALQERAWKILQDRYKIRREQGIDQIFDREWITGKRQVDLLAEIKTTPEKALKKLEEWYESIQKDNN